MLSARIKRNIFTTAEDVKLSKNRRTKRKQNSKSMNISVDEMSQSSAFPNCD
jgi:hypothetical protein